MGDAMEFLEEDTYKNLTGIYKIKNLINDKIYIGKTEVRFVERYWNHVWKLNNRSHDNKYLEKSWWKYGDTNFVFEVVHILDNDEDINNLENYYIELFDSFNNGYNLTMGGEGKRGYVTSDKAKMIIGAKNKINNLGKKHSEETKIKMRKSSRHLSPSPQTIEKIKLARTGIKASNETKEKLRLLNLGSKSPVAKINEDIVYKIKSDLLSGVLQKELSQKYDIPLSTISSIANNYSWTHVEIDGWNEYTNLKKIRQLSSVEKSNIDNYYSLGYSTYKISKILNRSFDAVKRYLNKSNTI